jgi:hypothetical protein
MSGSHRYLTVLESLRDLFVHYPLRAEMSSITLATDATGQVSIVVALHRADTAMLAAGVVEWRRTLAEVRTWAWRTPDGEELYVSAAGHAPECEGMRVAVIAGPVPQDAYLEHDLDPDVSTEIDLDTLYRWLGDEIANSWPFKVAPSA